MAPGPGKPVAERGQRRLRQHRTNHAVDDALQRAVGDGQQMLSAPSRHVREVAQAFQRGFVIAVEEEGAEDAEPSWAMPPPTPAATPSSH
jgi:hypothetical protein